MTNAFKIYLSALVFLFVGTVFVFNPFSAVGTFELPKMIVLLLAVGTMNILATFYIGQKFFVKLPHIYMWMGVLLIGQLVAFIFSADHLVSLVGTHYRHQGLLTYIHFILLSLHSYWFFTLFPAEQTKIVWRWIVGIGAGACVFAIISAFIPGTLFSTAFFEQRIYGTFGNPNYLAVFILVMLPFVFFSIDLKRLSKVGLAILFLTTLFFTGSRTALLVVGAVFGVYWAWYLWFHNKNGFFVGSILVILSLGILVIISSSSQTDNAFWERFSWQDKAFTSFETRLTFWQAGVEMYLDRPLVGHGQDMIQAHIMPYMPAHVQENDLFYVDRVHSEPLDMLLMYGPLTVLGYLGFFGLALFGNKCNVFVADKYWAILATKLSIIMLSLFLLINFSTITTNVFLFFLGGYLVSQNTLSKKH